MTSPATTEERPLRADARRNREKIVTAARECFGASGATAQVDDVARGAGVGIGTVYRHFPTKEALLGAVAAELFGELADDAEAVLAAEPPGEALFTFIRRSAQKQSEHRALSDVFFEMPELKAGAANELERLIRGDEALVAAAKRAGTLRRDFETTDIPLIMCAVGRVQAFADDATLWQRHLDFVLAGLRPA
jgi:AcrR family transcriptional regulator